VDVQITRLRRKIEDDPKPAALSADGAGRGLHAGSRTEADGRGASAGASPGPPGYLEKRKTWRLAFDHPIARACDAARPPRAGGAAGGGGARAGGAGRWTGATVRWAMRPMCCAATRRGIWRGCARRCREGWAQLDADTFLSPGTLEAAMRAVGGSARRWMR
jgi:hypothetical protein